MFHTSFHVWSSAIDEVQTQVGCPALARPSHCKYSKPTTIRLESPSRRCSNFVLNSWRLMWWLSFSGLPCCTTYFVSSLNHPMFADSFVCNVQIRGLIKSEVFLLLSVAWSGQGMNSLTSVVLFSECVLTDMVVCPQTNTVVLFFLSCLSWHLHGTSTAVLKIDFCHFQWSEMNKQADGKLHGLVLRVALELCDKPEILWFWL